MARLRWTLTDSQADKFKKYCETIGNQIKERPGFVFKRVVWMINLLFSEKFNLEQINDGFHLLIKLKKEGCDFKKVQAKIKEILNLLN